jgi:hypothetical protein
LATQGRPLKTSILTAGFMAALLTSGLIACLLELLNSWEHLFDKINTNPFIIIWSVILVIWAIWSIIFFAYFKQGDRYSQLGKMIRGLVAGSILETIVAIPVQIWASNQRECYCARGSYTSLVFSATVLIWAFGPGIVLLYLREKIRMQRLTQSENQAEKA